MRQGLQKEGLSLLAAIPGHPQFTWLRAQDVADQLQATQNYTGEAATRRVTDIR